ncbi:putative transposable element [Trichonephila clavipes]|nr:putative transposable element [Trichonephila clavipes]
MFFPSGPQGRLGWTPLLNRIAKPEYNINVKELWFQQDGATCHTARATIYLLKDTLGDRLISRFGPVNWPPRSCDLTPLDYFLWGYVKSLVYADKPQTLDHLEDNIRRVIADIRPQMLEKVIENWTSRLDFIRASRGSPMPEIIFKMPRPNTVNNNSPHLLKILPTVEAVCAQVVPVYPLGAWGGCPGAWKGPDKLDLTRLSGSKFRSVNAKGACRSSAPRTRNELKSALGPGPQKVLRRPWLRSGD